MERNLKTECNHSIDAPGCECGRNCETNHPGEGVQKYSGFTADCINILSINRATRVCLRKHTLTSRTEGDVSDAAGHSDGCNAVPLPLKRIT